ncbi:MAG: translation initiation factor IF-2 N-terminal domain-containing protein, partial [Candidatus Absconditabacteria bacterium]
MPLKKVSAKVTSDAAQVRKANEIGSGGGFLSGLGFTQKKAEPVVIHNDQDETVIAPKVSKAKDIPVVPVAPKEKNDFLSNFLAGKDDIIVPNKIDLKEIHQEPKKAEPDLSFFDGVKRYEAPKRPNQITKPGAAAPVGGARPQGPRGNIQTRPGQYNPKPGYQGKHPHPQTPTVAAPVIKKVEKIATTSENLVKKIEIVIEDKITVKEFSEKMGIPLPQVIKKLMENKIMTSITASLDFDTAALIAEELGVIVKKSENKLNVESFMNDDLQSILALDKDAAVTETRPPIVTIMGHVDHGKTSLLDYLRKTGVAGGEAGGITQGIGASMVEYDGKKICFIDTPGHQLFTSLRARGAKLTNIAVIVVAADDSVMPQTVESIGHAKEAGVPIIIAITKIDKPGKNIEQIKQDLAQYQIIPEDRGGDTPIIGISSKTGEGIDDLLQTILLQSEILDLKFDPKRAAAGVVLDAHKDPKQGVVSTMIIMTGTLKVGDIVVAYNTYGKVRRMQNWKGQNILKAIGGEPVQVLGITSLPEPGRIVEVDKNEKEAQQKVMMIQEQA